MGAPMKRARQDDEYDSFEDDEADNIFIASQVIEASQQLQKTTSSSASHGPPPPKRHFGNVVRPIMRPPIVQNTQQRMPNNPKNTLKNFKIPVAQPGHQSSKSKPNDPESTISLLRKQLEEMTTQNIQQKGVLKHLQVKLSKAEQVSSMCKAKMLEQDRTNKNLVEQFQRVRNQLDFNIETMPFQNENNPLRKSVSSRIHQTNSNINARSGSRIFIHDDSAMDVDIAYVTKQTNVPTTMAPITAQPIAKKPVSNMEVQTVESKTRKTPESYRRFKASFDIIWKKRADFIKPNTKLKSAFSEVNSLFGLGNCKDSE